MREREKIFKENSAGPGSFAKGRLDDAQHKIKKEKPLAQAETAGDAPLKAGGAKPGDVVTLRVARLGENGAFLDAGTGNTSDDILLHRFQQTEPVTVGQEVKVYLYLDPAKRLTASMKLPKLKEGQVTYARVISVTRDGGFVDLGGERGVFLPYSEMRGYVRPEQLVWVKLYKDKSGRPAVTMRVEEELQRAAKPAENVRVGDKLEGIVYNIVPEGFFLFSKERYIIFLHREQVPGGRLDFGQKVECWATFIRPDGRVNASLRPPKEEALYLDAQRLEKYMQERGGSMPYGDGTPPEIIKQKFDLSKAAFKRALGHLLKEGKISQEDGWTRLVQDSEDGEL